MPKRSSRRARTTLLTTACLFLGAAALPLACSSKTAEVEPGAIARPCSSDAQCPGAHCDNGTCMPNCTPGGGQCGPTQICGADGRCSDVSTGGSSGTGGSSSGGTGNIIVLPDSGADADDGSLDPDAACGTGSARAMLTPVSMFVMFDRSTSMIENPPMPPTRWETASSALKAFFEDPAAADLAVGLRFFPHDTPAAGCTGTGMPNCDSMACAQPLVPLMADPVMPLPKLTAEPAATTDAHEQALVAAIMSSAPVPPGTGTPIYSALDGALTWATAYQAAHPRPEQQTVVVLVTDGEPTSCSADTRNVDNIAMLASNALMASGVRTYTVGLSDSMTGLTFLTQIATAGGGQAFFVMDGATAAAELIAALKAIQGNALSCDFPYPQAEDGGMADPTRINVDYTAGTPGSMPQRIFQVTDAAACGTQPGWYYDSPTMPTRIHLCPASCTTVSADPGAALDIQIGCVSIVRPPS
jgi:hypothetical protein